MSSFINPFTDIGFKKIFGQEVSKDLLINFLNNLLAGEIVINDLWQYDIKAVYCISFLNYHQDRISERFRTDVALMDMKSGKLFSSQLRLVYLQLPLFKKGFDDCENDFERWICVLKDMETLKRMPEAAKSAVFKKLEEITDLSSLTYDERMKYDRALKQFRDTYAVTEYAKNQGRAEGMAEGRAEREREIALNLKNKNVPLETIAISTGLTIEEIEQL